MRNRYPVLLILILLVVALQGGVLSSPAYAHEVIPPSEMSSPDDSYDQWVLTALGAASEAGKSIAAGCADTKRTGSQFPDNVKLADAEAENGILLSETPVNSFLVRFYDQDGELFYELPAIRGEQVEEPEEKPEWEGQLFAYWYLVDEELEGDVLQPYDFESAITGLTYLRAHFVPEEAEPDREDVPEQGSVSEPGQDPQIPDETESADEAVLDGHDGAVQDNREEAAPGEAAVQLAVILAAENEEVLDGICQVLLTGGRLPEEGITVANVGREFPFPELVFTAEDEGTHIYQVTVLEDEPSLPHTSDLDSEVMDSQELSIEVLVTGDGQVTTVVNYPDGADHLLIGVELETLLPIVRIYVNLQPGQLIDYGDEVVFTAKMENCGESPRIQWQYSPDNENWTDIAGADESELAIQITETNAAGYWRVTVTITD